VKNCVVFYFSATGNSLAVALELAQCLNAGEPISIPGSMVLDDPYQPLTGADCVGIVFPVHRAALPEMVRGFIEAMPVKENCYYFAVSTYSLFGCNEFWDADEVLRQKGALLNYAASVHMPGSIGLLAADSLVTAKRLQHVHWEVADIAEEIACGRENTFPRSFKGLGRLVKAYTEYRRRTISFKVGTACTRCGVCAQVCPAHNIKLDKDGAPVPFRSDHCEACLACVHWCPSRVLTAFHPVHSRYHHPAISPEQLNGRFWESADQP